MSDSVLTFFEPLYSAENQGVVTEYRFNIMNVKLFNIVVVMVALVSSFYLSSRQVIRMREELKF